MSQPQPVVHFRCFQTQLFTEKSVAFSGIQTRIVGAEGKHADHLTAITAHYFENFVLN